MIPTVSWCLWWEIWQITNNLGYYAESGSCVMTGKHLHRQNIFFDFVIDEMSLQIESFLVNLEMGWLYIEGKLK